MAPSPLARMTEFLVKSPLLRTWICSSSHSLISSTSSVFCELFPYSCSYKKNHFDVTVTVSWKCLAIRLHYIQHPFFLVSFPGKQTNRSTPGCPSSHAVISLWNHFHPWEQTEQDLGSVWLHILYKICTEQGTGCKLGHSACRPASHHQSFIFITA